MTECMAIIRDMNEVFGLPFTPISIHEHFPYLSANFLNCSCSNFFLFKYLSSIQIIYQYASPIFHWSWRGQERRPPRVHLRTMESEMEKEGKAHYQHYRHQHHQHQFFRFKLEHYHHRTPPKTPSNAPSFTAKPSPLTHIFSPVGGSRNLPLHGRQARRFRASLFALRRGLPSHHLPPQSSTASQS